MLVSVAEIQKLTWQALEKTPQVGEILAQIKKDASKGYISSTIEINLADDKLALSIREYLRKIGFTVIHTENDNNNSHVLFISW